MKATVFLLAFAAAALAQSPDETPTPPPDPKIDFKVIVVGKQRAFHIGEIIPIKLSFSSRLKRRYQIDEAGYDRSGRMNFEHFTVAPPDGAEDPLAEYFSPGSVHIGVGLRGFSFLTTKPWTIQLNLSEWVRFTKAGEYKVRIATSRVGMVDSSQPYGIGPATAQSNEVTLKILPRDSEWEKRTYDQAVAVLKNPSSDKEDKSGETPASRALEILRFLGTTDATRELANQLRGDDRRRGTSDCFFGLVSAPQREVARQTLEDALSEPDRPISDTLLDALEWIESRSGKKQDPKPAQPTSKTLEKAADAVGAKRGEALRLSLYAVLNNLWVRNNEQLISKVALERLIQQLRETFEEFPREQQVELLQDRWDKIQDPALYPILKRFAEGDDDGLAGIALRRWLELDPDGARPAIINEISRLKPRFGAPRLGILPDQTLPEVEQLLVEHLPAEVGSEGGAKIASLIERYATGAVLPRVLKTLDSLIGKGRCDVQNLLLAYVLRVDAESARPRVEKALAARGRNLAPCNQSVLCNVALIHYDPLLESIALRAVNDRDDRIAGDAAGLLSGYGSAVAEGVLWGRYEKWCKRWEGHERELNLQAVSALMGNGGKDEVLLGRSCVREIAEGRRWLTDEAKLQRLKAMSKVPTIQAEIDHYLENWRSPLSLMIWSCGGKSDAKTADAADLKRFSATVAQYSLDSMAALKERLSQFPRGTKFELSRFDKTDQACIDDLRSFLISREFSVTEANTHEGS